VQIDSTVMVIQLAFKIIGSPHKMRGKRFDLVESTI